MKLRRTKAAAEDLISIWAFVALENIAAADRIADQIENGELRLLQFPRLGVERPNLGEGVRSLFVREHVILYRIIDNAIEVLRIMDGRRNIRPEDLKQS